MANSHSVDVNHVPAANDDRRTETASEEEGAPAELASASMDEITRANEHSPQEEDAAAKLALASMNERYNANEHNPLEPVGAAELDNASLNGTSDAVNCKPQDNPGAEPVLDSMDPSSDVHKNSAREEDAASACTSASTDKLSDAAKSAHADVIARGISSVLGPVMNDFDSGIEGAFKSQGILASSIDRLTRELDKLLEDVPLPFTTQHATRLSGIRKRILTLNSSLRIIERRMETIQRLLAGYAAKAIGKDNQEKSSSFSRENSHSHTSSPSKVLPAKTMSSSSADDSKNDGHQISELAGTEFSDQSSDVQSVKLQDNIVQKESTSKELHVGRSNQKPHDDQLPNDLQSTSRDQ